MQTFIIHCSESKEPTEHKHGKFMFTYEVTLYLSKDTSSDNLFHSIYSKRKPEAKMASIQIRRLTVQDHKRIAWPDWINKMEYSRSPQKVKKLEKSNQRVEETRRGRHD